MDRETLVKFSALSVCCLVHLFWGSITTFTYYVNAIKVQYAYTQSQVELFLPVTCIGKVLSPVPAAVYQTWGLRTTVTVGLLLSCGGYILLWTSGFYLKFCHSFPVIIYTCFLLLGLGSGFLNLSVLTVVTRQFSGKHQGKAISMVMTFYAISPLLSLFIYRNVFAEGVIENDAGQDFHGFMMYSAISIATAGCLFLVSFRNIERPDPAETPLIEKLDKGDQETDRNLFYDIAVNIKEEIQRILQWPFQLLLWSFALTYAVYSGIDYNLALYAKSSGIYHVFDSVFVVFHIAIFVSRFSVGFVSDAFADSVPRTIYNAITTFILAICLCLASFIPTEEVTMYMLSITTGLAGGVVRPVIVTVLAKTSGEENFAKNWGIAYSFTAIILTIWASVFSKLQDAGNYSGDAECYGSHCLQWINVVTCSMIVISTCCSLTLALVKRF